MTWVTRSWAITSKEDRYTMGMKWAIFVNWSTMTITVCLLHTENLIIKSRIMAAQGLDRVSEGIKIPRSYK